MWPNSQYPAVFFVQCQAYFTKMSPCLGILSILGFTKRIGNLLKDVEEETGERKINLSWCFGAYYYFLLFLESCEYLKFLLPGPFYINKAPYLNTAQYTKVIVNKENCIECARNASQSL